MKAEKGDWIITGVNGEKYPVKPDIFEKRMKYFPIKLREVLFDNFVTKRICPMYILSINLYRRFVTFINLYCDNRFV